MEEREKQELQPLKENSREQKKHTLTDYKRKEDILKELKQNQQAYLKNN
jgi:hypothetical protein